MPKEIERKFLVDKTWKPSGDGENISQGYLSNKKEAVVRVRIKGKKGYLTVKGENKGITRAEFEYEIPVGDAEEMLKLCEKKLEKVRYKEKVGAHTFEIDVFGGDNEGLTVAEVELKSEDEAFAKPEWILEEVSGDTKYYNSNLVSNPYKLWKK